MKVDTATLTELGVLPSADTDWPLALLLDSTSGPESREELIRLLQSPLSSRTEILLRQNALRDLRPFVRNMDWREIGILNGEVLRFLNSSFTTFPRSAASGMVFRLRYREVADYVSSRMSVVATFLAHCGAIASAVEGIQGDTEMADAISTVCSVSRLPALVHIGRTATPDNDGRSEASFRLCLLDQVVRVDYRAEILKLSRALAKLEAFCSLAAVGCQNRRESTSATDIQRSSQNSWCFPEIMEERCAVLHIESLRHPLIAGGIANSVVQRKGERVVFLTGPNMSGKSTLMRSIGMAVHFAHIGLPVPAVSAKIPLVGVLISSMNERDNLIAGASRYLAEVRRAKTVVAAVAAGETVVALLDEVFRGTNVKDAMEATQLLIQGLASARSGLFVVASHLAEVCEDSSDYPGITPWCLRVDTEHRGPRFRYRLEPGISRQRLGLALLESEGVIRMLREIGRQTGN